MLFIKDTHLNYRETDEDARGHGILINCPINPALFENFLFVVVQGQYRIFTESLSLLNCYKWQKISFMNLFYHL